MVYIIKNTKWHGQTGGNIDFVFFKQEKVSISNYTRIVPGSQTVGQTLSERQTDRHEFRQTESQTNGKSDKQNVRQTESCKEVRQTVCQTDTKSVRHKVRQTESLTDRKSYRQWRWGTPSCIPQLSSQLKVTKVSHPVVPSWPWTWCRLL